MSNVIHVSKEDFEEKVLKSEKPVLVDFWATWCGPCKMIAPVLDEISKERQDIIIAKLDVDENQEISQRFGVRGIPTMCIFQNGEVEAIKVGATSKSALSAWIDSNI